MSPNAVDDVLRANLPRLVAFVRVVERGSLTRAAADMGVTRPAMSQSVRALEDALGVRLIDRSTRRVRPTQSGAQLYEAAAALLVQAREAIESATRSSDRPTGTLRVATAGGAVARALVIPAVEAVSRSSDLQVEVLVSDYKVSMIDHGIDVAVRLGVPAEEGMVVRSFAAFPQRIVAPPALASRARSIDALGELPWVIHRAQSPRLELTRGRERHAVRRHARYVVDSSDVALALVERGLGLGMLPSLLARDALRERSLVHLFPDWRAYDVRVFAALPSGRHLPARTRLFLTSLEQVVDQAVRDER